jgi:hypothetical protein
LLKDNNTLFSLKGSVIRVHLQQQHLLSFVS